MVLFRSGLSARGGLRVTRDVTTAAFPGHGTGSQKCTSTLPQVEAYMQRKGKAASMNRKRQIFADILVWWVAAHVVCMAPMHLLIGLLLLLLQGRSHKARL